MKSVKIAWDLKGNPNSTTYDETYFSTNGGLEESRHVFLEGNDVSKRWKNKKTFVIAECGFGTGLNLLATIELYKKSQNRPKFLYFISIENEPLMLQDLKKSHTNYPSLQPFATTLYQKYPPLIQGFHFIDYDANIKIILCFYDVHKALTNLTCKVDAWYLDGFSPAKNSKMWDKKTFSKIANLSKIGTTAASYSVARVVKDGLENNGFSIEKTEGFKTKKHMLKAICTNPNSKEDKPWFSLANTFTCKEKKALIIGAGIAGSSIAYRLAQHGWSIDILDKRPSAGLEASGNHCGVVAPLITQPNIPLGQMYMSAFLQSLSFYKEVVEYEGKFQGVKHYAHNKAFEKRWKTWNELENSLFTCKEDRFGKYFDIHEAGYVQPYKLCPKLINTSKHINFHNNKEVVNFIYENNKWLIKTADNKTFQAPVLILALGANTIKLLPNKSFALQKIRGQVTLLPPTLEIKKPLCDEGYICPSIENKQVIGATYRRHDANRDIRAKDNEENLKNIQKFLPLKHSLNSEDLDGRVSYRLSSNDRFPIIGKVHDEGFFKQEYKSIPWTKHKPHLHKHATYLPHLYISAAHGSRGLTSAILGANIITAMIENLPIPLEKSLLYELHPARFTIRRISKQEIW